MKIENKRRPKSRGNGQGTAYWSKRCRCWVSQVVIGWRIPEDESRHPIPIKRSKFGFATKKDALAFCPTLLSGGIEKPKTAPRLSHYWTIYSTNRMQKIGKSKQSAYKTAWNKMKDIHDVRVDSLTVETLQGIVSSVASSHYTQKDCRTVLIKLFELAAIDGFANKDLPNYIEILPLEEAEHETFTREEQESLWKLYESGDMTACVPLLMIYTGMMPGEAMLLKTEHIDLGSRQIVGVGMKTKVRKKTPVVIADILLPVVEDLIAHAQPNGYIWPRNEARWYENYYASLSSAGCRRLPPYSCRHTTATALAVDRNIAPQTIRRVMRWSTAKMLDRYAHPDQTDALAAVNQLKK